MTIDIEQLKADMEVCEMQNAANGNSAFPCATDCPCALSAEVIRLTERLRLYEGQKSTPETPVGFDGMASEMSGTIQHQAARIAALEAKMKAADELAEARSDCLNEFCESLRQVCDVKLSHIVLALPPDVKLYRAQSAGQAIREVQS